MVVVPCCWKPWWIQPVFAGSAIGRPTGYTWVKLPDAAAWIASTKLTVKPSETSTYIRWCATPSSSCAVISRGKQIQLGLQAAQACTVEVACRESADVLAENPLDIPFATIYVTGENGAIATRIAEA